MKPKAFHLIFISYFLVPACLFILASGCSSMTVKHVNPDEPNVLEGNERVVFGRVVFVTHSEEMGEVSFPPLGLGLVHVERGKRATGSAVYAKTVIAEPPSGDLVTRELPTRKPWFENDGTFFWVLPTGRYQIDALGWGLQMKVSAQDLRNQKPEQVFSLKPEKPPECGFVVSPNTFFDVSGDSGALYVGSLVIDMDIRIEKGVEVRRVNRIEIEDEYAETIALLKSRCPSFASTFEKRLMMSIPDRTVSVANRRCPTWYELLLRALVGVAIQMGPAFIPLGHGISPSISIPSFGN